MSKVLITSIGTGEIKKDSDSDYEETTYRIGDKEYRNTLTSQPIVEHFGIDRIIFIGTTGSMWDNLYYKYGGEDEEYLDMLTAKKREKTVRPEDLRGLEEQLDAYLGSSGSRCILIDYKRHDEDEIWSNFEKILKVREFLQKGDEVYIDITHGFRYMPILNIFAMEFISKLDENFRPKAILYGMFAGDRSQILDFGIFLELLEWATAVEEMERFASMDRLVRLSQGRIEKHGYDTLVQAKEAFEIANMSAVHRSINKLKNHLDYFTENQNAVIRLVAPAIESFIKKLSDESLSGFQFKLAHFFGSKRNYALAYIALVEAIISYVCENSGLEVDKRDDREEAKDMIYANFKYPPNSRQRKFAQLFDKINDIRKTIAHQLPTSRVPKRDIENFTKYYEESRRYLKELYG